MSSRAIKSAYNGSGSAIKFGGVVGEGGEGCVLDLQDQPQNVVKLYHKPLDSDKAQKIGAMVNLSSDRLVALSAWPIDLIYAQRGGTPIGLIMPKVSDHRPGHQLYSPKDRLSKFPNATWPFLIHTCANIARAFAIIHEHGHVIGDVNQGNFLISPKATVKLIDCDSFQISAAGRRFLCEVGVPTHTPPELQDKPFKNVIRTANHDNFGLAVIIFQMLFMGRHPYSGRFLGTGEMPIERAIKEFRFAYGNRASAKQMKAPPATPSLAIVTDHLAQMFNAAFFEEGTAGNRPTANQWIAALESLASQIKPCSAKASHHFVRGANACPWCEMESQSGINLFPAVIQGTITRGGTFSIDTIWADVTSVHRPPPVGQFPIPLPARQRIPAGTKAATRGHARRFRVVTGVIITVVICALLVVGWQGVGILLALAVLKIADLTISADIAKEVKTSRQSILNARSQLKSMEERWKREAQSSHFDDLVRTIEQKIQQWRQLPAEKQQRMRQLEIDKEKIQRRKYLDRFRLDDHRISGIGPGRKATLQSYGIETAADVSQYNVMSVPGFGPATTQKLLSWKYGIESSFRFDPSRQVDPADRLAVEQDISSKQFKLEAELSSAPRELQQLAAQIVATRQQLHNTINDTRSSEAQMRADVRAMKWSLR